MATRVYSFGKLDSFQSLQVHCQDDVGTKKNNLKPTSHPYNKLLYRNGTERLFTRFYVEYYPAIRVEWWLIDAEGSKSIFYLLEVMYSLRKNKCKFGNEIIIGAFLFWDRIFLQLFSSEIIRYLPLETSNFCNRL